MSNDPSKTANPPSAQIHGVYLRNVSLETGISPLLVKADVRPEIQLELKVKMDVVTEKDEVTLELNIAA